MTSAVRFAITSLSACLLLSGCRIVTHKDGKNDNVDIGTPFGSVHVNTNDAHDTSAIGLTPYPGAIPLKENGDKDANSANVDMSFGSFHLGVKAATFQTSDAPDKVIAFYRKDLSRYGEVIECRGKSPIGTPTRTAQGLGCDDNGNVSHSTDSSGGKGFHMHGTLNGSDVHSDADGNVELRAGSEQHQHIVGLDPKDGGTKIGLVALDLPVNLKGKSGNPE